MPSSIHDKALHELLSELPPLNTSPDSKEEKKSEPDADKTKLQTALEIAKKHIAADANIDLLTSNWSVLQLAVVCGDSAFIQQLIKRGVNTNLITSQGTALYLAVKQRSLSLIQLLVEVKDQKESKDEKQESPKSPAADINIPCFERGRFYSPIDMAAEAYEKIQRVNLGLRSSLPSNLTPDSYYLIRSATGNWKLHYVNTTSMLEEIELSKLPGVSVALAKLPSGVAPENLSTSADKKLLDDTKREIEKLIKAFREKTPPAKELLSILQYLLQHRQPISEAWLHDRFSFCQTHYKSNSEDAALFDYATSSLVGKDCYQTIRGALSQQAGLALEEKEASPQHILIAALLNYEAHLEGQELSKGYYHETLLGLRARSLFEWLFKLQQGDSLPVGLAKGDSIKRLSDELCHTLEMWRSLCDVAAIPANKTTACYPVIAQRLIHLLKCLPAGAEYPLPTGWSGKVGEYGHAVCLSFMRKSDSIGLRVDNLYTTNAKQTYAGKTLHSYLEEKPVKIRPRVLGEIPLAALVGNQAYFESLLPSLREQQAGNLSVSEGLERLYYNPALKGLQASKIEESLAYFSEQASLNCFAKSHEPGLFIRIGQAILCSELRVKEQQFAVALTTKNFNLAAPHLTYWCLETTPRINCLTPEQALREKYKLNTSITRLFYPKDPLAIQDIYINLSIVKEETQQKKEATAGSPSESKGEAKEEKGEKKISDALSTYEEIYGSKESLTLDKLFEKAPTDVLIPNRQLILGRAGIGKSTLCRYIAYQWAKEALWQGKYLWLFWLPLRNLADVSRYPQDKTHTLIDILQREFFPEHPPEKVAALAEILNQKKDRVLWLLDGYDEVTPLEERLSPSLKDIVSALLNPIRWPHSLVTSRPYSIPIHDFDRRLEVMGFTEENVTAYVQKFFVALRNPERANKAAEGLKALFAKQPKLRGTARIPINLELICSVWERQGQLQTTAGGILTFTGLYQQILDQLLRRYLEIQHKKSTHLLTAKQVLNHALCKPVLEFLENLAYAGMQQPSIILPSDVVNTVYETVCDRYPELPEPLFGWILQAGFIKATTEGQAELAKNYYFIHLSFQEFFAAHYLAAALEQSPESTHFKEATRFISTQKYRPRYALVWSLTTGLLSADQTDNGKIKLQLFWDQLEAAPRDLVGLGHQELVIRCLDEVQDDGGLLKRKEVIHYFEQWQQLIKKALSKEKTDQLVRQNWSVLCGVFRQTVHFTKKPAIANIFLKALVDKSDTVADKAEKALRALGASIATPEILTALCNRAINDKDEWVRKRALEILGAFGISAATPKVLTTLCKAMEDHNERVSQEALNTLVAFGASAATPEVLTILCKAMAGKRRIIRIHAIEALGKLGTPAATSEVLTAICDVMKDEDCFRMALETLGAFGVSVATSKVLTTVLKAVRDKDDWVSCTALKTLRAFGTSVATAEVLTIICNVLEHKGMSVKQIAVKTLMALDMPTAISDRVLTILCKAIGDKDTFVIEDALKALATLGTPAITPSVLTAVCKAMDSGIKIPALETLRAFGTTAATPEVLTVVYKAVGNINYDVRRAALKTLVTFGKLATAASLTLLCETTQITIDNLTPICEVMTNESSLARQKALEILGAILKAFGASVTTPKILTTVCEAIQDKDADVRRAALKTLGLFGASAATPEVLTTLCKVMEDNCDSFADNLLREAVETLQLLDPPAVIPEMFANLCKIVNKLKPPLEPKLYDIDGMAKNYLLHALGILVASAITPEVLITLYKAFEDSKEMEGIENAAREALRRISARTMLATCLLDKNPDETLIKAISVTLTIQTSVLMLTEQGLQLCNGRTVEEDKPIPIQLAQIPAVKRLLNKLAEQAQNHYLPGGGYADAEKILTAIPTNGESKAEEKQAESKHTPIPPNYFCQFITKEVLFDPVMTADGHTYEREAIQQWLEDNDTSPATGAVLPNKILVPNISIRQMVQEFLEANPSVWPQVYIPEIPFQTAILDPSPTKLELLLNKNGEEGARYLDAKNTAGKLFFHEICEKCSIAHMRVFLKKLAQHPTKLAALRKEDKPAIWPPKVLTECLDIAKAAQDQTLYDTTLALIGEGKAEEKKKAEGSAAAGPPPPPPAPPLPLPPPMVVNSGMRFFSSGPRRDATDLAAGTKIDTPII